MWTMIKELWSDMSPGEKKMVILATITHTLYASAIVYIAVLVVRALWKFLAA
jgi:hypothetical protein